jgi:hypothetical protein
MIARLARAVSRLLGIPVGREGINVRPAGVHVLVKATAFRTRMTPAKARALARGLELAAWDAEQEEKLRAAAAAAGIS